jgi:hypothetical protein
MKRKPIISRPKSTEEAKIAEVIKTFIVKWADLEVQEILLAESVGMSDKPVPKYPLWVKRCAEKVNRALLPKVFESVESNKTSFIGQAGLAFGLMSAGQAKLKPELKNLRKIVGESGADTTFAQDIVFLESFRSGNNEPLLVAKNGDMIAPKFREKIRQIESQAALSDLTKFYKGMCDAALMVNGENKTTDTTAIYQLMLTFWRLVEQFTTAQKFFEFLTLILGRNRVGDDPKRVQQMCARIGKTFAKPGRPRKTTSTRLAR